MFTALSDTGVVTQALKVRKPNRSNASGGHQKLLRLAEHNVKANRRAPSRQPTKRTHISRAPVDAKLANK